MTKNRDKVQDFFERHKRPIEEQMDEQGALAEELMSKDPKLTFLSAFIIAGDLLSIERAKKMLKEGIDFDDATAFVGSYGRLEFALWAKKNGYTTLDHLLNILPDLWRGSDPDDSKVEYHALWLQAWEKNNRKTILDGKHLPRGKYLTIYRGQDEDQPTGISWSLREEVARKFANGAATRQLNRGGVVYEGQVLRSKIIAYLTLRNEEEVIVSPLNVRTANDS